MDTIGTRLRRPKILPIVVVLAAVSAACSGRSTGLSGESVSATIDPAAESHDAGAPTTGPATTVPVVIITTTAPPVSTSSVSSADESTTTELPSTTAPTSALPPGAATPPTCSTVPAGVTNTSIAAGGSVHDLRIFVPPSAVGAGLMPTVLDWHGYNQSGPVQAALSGFEALAESEEFMVVHPTGVPNPGRTANGWELDPARDPGRDDLAFVGALIDELVASWCADPARVYSTGMSDGGFFTSILVCEMADRIAAATSIAGVMRTPGCHPSRVVPYYAFHGTDDPVEPFAPDFAAFEQFAADAGCGPPDKVNVTAEVTVFGYTGCPLRFFRIEGGGHAWPGSPVADAQPAWLGHTTMDIDATALSWELFKDVSMGG